jgi:hypothetical protein
MKLNKAYQEAQRHDRKAGREYGLAAWKLFSVLIFFGPFLYQDKKGLASAANERRMFSVKTNLA